MKYKTKLLVDRFTSIVSAWDGVDCVTVNEAALPDTLDPYFALILDIYYREPIPGPEERQSLFGEDLDAFETSARGNKDRFLIGNIPVRLEYKSVRRIEELISIADTRLENLWLIKDKGTYGFYRLSNGEVIFSRNDWIKDMRLRLKNLEDEFWQNMRTAHTAKMEHFLSDLGAAVMQGDDFFYLLSAAGFIKNACLTLFCINKRFEPSHKAYYRHAMELKELPDSFKAYFETFLRTDSDTSMERKFSIAQHIAKGIISL
jgi:hypothetical protein